MIGVQSLLLIIINKKPLTFLAHDNGVIFNFREYLKILNNEIMDIDIILKFKD